MVSSLFPGRDLVLVVDLHVVRAHDLYEVLAQLEKVVGPLRLREADEVQHGFLGVRGGLSSVEEEARHVRDARRRLQKGIIHFHKCQKLNLYSSGNRIERKGKKKVQYIDNPTTLSKQ